VFILFKWHDCLDSFNECFIAATHDCYLQLNTSTVHGFCLSMLCTHRENSHSGSETNARWKSWASAPQSSSKKL